MKYIQKLPENEPRSLIKHRATSGSNYDGCNKEDIRTALLMEQGYICAYCMKRIEEGMEEVENKENKIYLYRTNIEHYIPQSVNRELSMVFSNMLGVCNGNAGRLKHLHHCDKSRGNELLNIDPRNITCETFIQYSSNGEIKSANQQINKDLNDVLKLNIEELVQERKRIIDTASKRMQIKYKRKSGQNWSKSDLLKEIKFWSERKDNRFEPFCGAAVAYLKNKLSRIS